jgi:DNA-binding transcriptional MerR regulator
MTTADLPEKLYFKIGEVSKLVGVKPYVLRYWESEFSIVKPGKTTSRHRLYRRRDVETLLEICRLLHVERYTIEGAKRRLRETGRVSATPAAQPDTAEVLAAVRSEIQDLCRLLEPEGTPAALTIGDRVSK